MTLGGLALFSIHAMVELYFLDPIDRTQMNIHRKFAQAGSQAAGVIARVLRTPRTLAFPGHTR
jgi:hypothetical protein